MDGAQKACRSETPEQVLAQYWLNSLQPAKIKYQYKCSQYIIYHFLKSIIMDNTQHLALMDKIIRELDDLRNSQTSVLKKIAQIEADNINLGSEVLSEGLPGIHEEVDGAVEKVTELLEQFRESRNEFEKDHPAPVITT